MTARNSDPVSVEWHRTQLEALAAWRDAEVEHALDRAAARAMALLIPIMLAIQETQTP